MRLADLVFAPWAITPDMYSEIVGIYSRHVRGEKIDIRALEASIGRPLNNAPKGYTIHGNGVAVLPIEGVMSKRMNLFSEISGGTSTQKIGNDIRAAAKDPNVKSIILHIDSPGGAVDGTQELAALVREVREQKPVVALADGLMASAGYWVGSAAEKIYITSDTTQVGSIGVVATHRDYSAAEAQQGIKTTEITAGKYKRIASSYSPLTEEGKQSIQESVDHVYSVFVDDVAKNRGTTADVVLEKMADGRIFQGKQAIKAGLVDGVSSLDQLIADLSSDETASGHRAAVSAGTPNKTKEENNAMITKEKVSAEYPEIAEAFRAEGRASVDVSAAKTEAATAERDRIKGVFAQAMPGHEAIVEGMAFDGKSTGGDVAMAIVAAEKKTRATIHTNMRTEAPAAVNAAASSTGNGSAETSNQNLSVEDRAKKAWDNDSSIRAEFDEFKDYLAYEKGRANGNVRVKGA